MHYPSVTDTAAAVGYVLAFGGDPVVPHRAHHGNVGAGGARPPQPAPEVPSPAVVPFGGTYTWPDGIQVTVGRPEPYTPSGAQLTALSPDGVEYIPPQGEPLISMAATVVNGSTDDYNSTAFQVIGPPSTMRALDPVGGVVMPPAELSPGVKTNFRIVLTAADPAGVAVQIAPGFQYALVTFS